MQFIKFVNTFMSVCEARKNSVGEMAQKRLALENHLVPFFGEKDMADIKAKDSRDYAAAKLSEGYADKTINNHLLVLNRFLNVAREEGVLNGPKAKVERIPTEWSEARYLNAKEIKALLRAAAADAEHYHQMIVLSLNTGIRSGELLGLSWKDVDLDHKKLRIRKSLCRTSGQLKAPKNGKQRDVFLNDAALKCLDSVAAPSERVGMVFNVKYSAAHDAIVRIGKKAGLEAIGWHTLRHTFASLLVLEGVPLFTVSRLLGHSSIRITERYAHLNDEKNKDAVACLATAMEG